jgi:hydroxymethylglutaryl-CoA reductase
MAIEEPSVVAAASHAAKLARAAGGFEARADESIMIGQIQLVRVAAPRKVCETVLAHEQEILAEANACDPVLVKLGGGARELRVKVLETSRGVMVVVELLVDVKDAMGANAVNTMAEAVAGLLEKLAGADARLRIISNLAVERLARARAKWDKNVVGGEALVDGILDAYAFAVADPYRCATHNKGIMNGIDAVVIATGNDFRAVEAGAHAYAALSGTYQPLTRYWKDEQGNLCSEIELPLAVGIVGGATRTHPTAKIALKILDVSSAKELAAVLAAVGLAQNFAALRALVKEGIQRGHMALHARNIAIQAGASGELIEEIAEILVREKKIRLDRARELLRAWESKPSDSKTRREHAKN